MLAHAVPDLAARLRAARAERRPADPGALTGAALAALADAAPRWERASPACTRAHGRLLVRIDPTRVYLTARVAAALGGRGAYVAVDACRQSRRWRLSRDERARGWRVGVSGYIGGPALVRWLSERGVVPGRYEARPVADGVLEL